MLLIVSIGPRQTCSVPDCQSQRDPSSIELQVPERGVGSVPALPWGEGRPTCELSMYQHCINTWEPPWVQVGIVYQYTTYYLKPRGHSNSCCCIAVRTPAVITSRY